MKKILLSSTAIITYVFILIFPPPLEVTRLFLDFRFGTTIILWILIALTLRKKGAQWEAFALTLTLLLFSTTLIYKWQISMYDSQFFGGLLPWSDASAYFTNAQLLLQGSDLNSFGARRPLFSGILSGLLLITGNRLKVSIAILVAINGISAFLAAREIQKTHNTFSASFFIMIYYWYYAPYSGSVMSENLGLSLGALSLAILLKWTRNQPNLLLLGSGLFTLTTALNARAGAFFILPAILLWAGLSAQKKSLDLRAIAIGSAAIVLAITINMGLTKLLSSPDNLPFSNYSYTIYGIASGYKGWNQASFDHPGASPKEIYSFTFEKIKSSPILFVKSVGISYQDFFTPTNGAFSFLRLVHDQRNRGNNFLWLLTILALFSALIWRKEKSYSLMLASFIGIFASAGLLPPCDSDSMRAYAATIPFTIYIVSTTMAIPRKIFSHQTEIEIAPDADYHSYLLLPFTCALIISSTLVPFIVKWSGSLDTGTTGALSCPDGQESIIFSIGRQSSITLTTDSSLRESYTPTLHFTDFKSSIEYGAYHGTYPPLDSEIINNVEGGQTISIGMISRMNSKSSQSGYLVTPGVVLEQGVHHICARPSSDQHLHDRWYYQDDSKNNTQTSQQSFFQVPLFATTATRLLYALGIFIFLFLLTTHPKGFILSPNRKRFLLVGRVLLIIASISIYLHRTAMLPFAWETQKLNMKNALHVEGYLYQLPLEFRWMDQKEISNAPVSIYENGTPLKNPHSKFYSMKNIGKGRFSTQSGYIFLSASDNSNPTTNEKTYEIHWPKPIHPIFEFTIYTASICSVFFLLLAEEQSKYNKENH